MTTSYSLPLLPGDIEDIENKVVLKKLANAHLALAELKGVSNSIPNQAILINILSLQEAKDSSEIENIITTQDDLYRSDSEVQQFVTVALQPKKYTTMQPRYEKGLKPFKNQDY